MRAVILSGASHKSMCPILSSLTRETLLLTSCPSRANPLCDVWKKTATCPEFIRIIPCQGHMPQWASTIKQVVSYISPEPAALQNEWIVCQLTILPAMYDQSGGGYVWQEWPEILFSYLRKHTTWYELRCLLPQWSQMMDWKTWQRLMQLAWLHAVWSTVGALWWWQATSMSREQRPSVCGLTLSIFAYISGGKPSMALRSSSSIVCAGMISDMVIQCMAIVHKKKRPVTGHVKLEGCPKESCHLKTSRRSLTFVQAFPNRSLPVLCANDLKRHAMCRAPLEQITC